MVRHTEQVARWIKVPVIKPPGVHAHGLERGPIFGLGFGESVKNLLKQSDGIPVYGPVEMNLAIGKGMNHFQSYGTAVVFTGKYPTALSSEVNSEVDFFGIHRWERRKYTHTIC